MGILADSTCDFNQELLEKYDVHTFPLHIHLGNKAYLDGVDITPDDLYKWADANEETPKTSALSISEASSCLEKMIKEYESVLVFTISESMSSCASVMHMATIQNELSDKVKVIDSKNLSTGIALQIIYARTLQQQGLNVEEIIAKILQMQEKVRSSFVVDTLTYLHRGGRCNGAAAFVGNSFKLHPSIKVEQGAMKVGKFYRGKMNKALLKYVEDLKEGLMNAKEDVVFITHSGCEQEVIDAIKANLEAMNYFKNIYITRAGSVISSHCGPRTLGVLYVEK